MNNKSGDVTSVALFLKMVNDYKAYDKRQKEIIAKYQRQIENLKWEVENLTECLQEIETLTPDKLRTKVKNQRVALREYLRRIDELTEENKRLNKELMEERQKQKMR